MIGDVDVYGVFVPSFAVFMLAGLVASFVIRRVFAFAGGYRLVWHRALFDLALYVVVLGVVWHFATR